MPLFVAMLFTFPLTESQIISRPPGTAIVVLLVLSIAFVFFIRGDLVAKIPRLAIYTFFPLAAILIGHVYLLEFSEATTALLPVYMFFVASVLLFIIPYRLNPSIAYSYVARVAALIGLIGLPAAIWGQFDYGVFTLSTTVSPANDLLPPIGVNPLYSVYRNPNFLAKLLFVGLVASFGEWIAYNNRIGALLVVLNTMLLYLTESRGGMVAALVGVIALLGYYGVDQRLAVIGACSGVASVAAALITVVVAPSQVAEVVDLTGRLSIWSGTVDTVAHTNPVFGPGLVGSEFLSQTVGLTVPSPHSTYFKMLLRAGGVGLVLWIVLLWGSLLDGVYQRVHPTAVAVGAGFIVLGFIEGPNVFGTGTGSLLLTLTIGYLLTKSPGYTIQFVADERRDTKSASFTVNRYD